MNESIFSIIVPSYRNPRYLDLCLKSIVEGQTRRNEIIVVLDGFPSEYAGFAQRYPQVNFLELPQNMGMQYAINLGVYNATNEQIIICNDDNVFPSQWNEKLKDCLPNGLLVNNITTIDQIEPTGPGMFGFHDINCGTDVTTFNMEAFEEACKQVDVCPTKELPISHDGRIFPFIISKRNFMTVGGFDTFYPSPNMCDWDFFLKLELLGKTFVRTHAAHLYHFGSVATKKNAESSQFIAREQKAISTFIYKWGFHPQNGYNNTKLPQESLVNGIRFR